MECILAGWAILKQVSGLQPAAICIHRPSIRAWFDRTTIQATAVATQWDQEVAVEAEDEVTTTTMAMEGEKSWNDLIGLILMVLIVTDTDVVLTTKTTTTTSTTGAHRVAEDRTQDLEGLFNEIMKVFNF